MRKNFLITTLVLIAACLKLNAQCGPYGPTDCKECITILSPGSVTICPGATLTFNPAAFLSIPTGYTISSYSWSPGTGVTPASGSGLPPITSISPVLTYSPTCGAVSNPYTLSLTALSPNEFANGDFHLGNTDFCSALTYTTPSLLSSGNYTICNDAASVTSWFITPPAHFRDHDAPHNNMMVLFGTGPNLAVWTETENICPGVSYTFSFWQAALNTYAGPAYNPSLEVDVTDADGTHVFGTYTTTAMDVWQNFNFVYTPSPTAGSIAKFSINTTKTADIQSQTGKYIFALDDISLTHTCKSTANLDVIVQFMHIYGPTSVCQGDIINLSTCAAGFSFSSSNPAVATIDAGGGLTGVAAGTAVETVTSIPGGCTATSAITVDPTPSISGPGSVCADATLTWTAGSGSGTWSGTGSLTSGTSGISSTGSFSTGPYPGSGYISYTDAATTCSVTVGPLSLVAPPIVTGPTAICPGYYNGGTWVSSSGTGTWGPIFPMVPISGPGPSTSATFYGYYSGWGGVTFTESATGCSTIYNVLVNPTPDHIPNTSLCIGSAYTMSDNPTGGVWGCADVTVATIDPVTGVLTTGATGMTTGLAIITYTSPAGCTNYSNLYVYDCEGGDGLIATDVCDSTTNYFPLASGIPTGGVWTCAPTSTEYSIDPVTGAFTCATSYSGPITITYTAGTSTWTSTIHVIQPTTACITITSTDNFTLTSPCPGAIIYYALYDPTGMPLGFLSAPAGTSLSYSALVATYSLFPSHFVYSICEYQVFCNGCTWTSGCCVNKDDFGHFGQKQGGNNTTGINELPGNMDNLQIIPNPNNGSFRLSAVALNTTDQDVTIEVIDLLGRVVYQDKATMKNGIILKDISLENKYANGTYLISVRNANINRVLHFVLSR